MTNTEKIKLMILIHKNIESGGSMLYGDRENYAITGNYSDSMAMLLVMITKIAEARHMDSESILLHLLSVAKIAQKT